jgi:DNA-directed RNA polymerase subunit M/transcription elongation factor TFIIS
MGGTRNCEDDEFRARTLVELNKLLPEIARDEQQVHNLECACWERAVQAENVSNKTQPLTTTGAETTGSRSAIVRAAYAQACRNAVANLTTRCDLANGNDWLRDSIARGEVNIAGVPNMTADELAPGAGHAAPRRCRASADAIASDAFECPCCSERKCVHYELQTRSADEATTIFVTCVACGHRWTE